jgi:fatty acid desaturase
VYRSFIVLLIANVLMDLLLRYILTGNASTTLPFADTVPVALLLLALSVALKTYSILRLGKFIIPITRAFMHAQMHHKFGSSSRMNAVLNHGISLIFSLPQTAYVVGHRVHHRHDNDWSPDGLPKDPQSTFMFSKTSKPLNMWLWIPYIMFAFQIFIAPYLALKVGRTKEKVWLILESLTVLLFHIAMYKLAFSFYCYVYLPSLLIAWYLVACSLYMQHNVSADSYSLHPSCDCLSKSFNSFAANDGYHLEHSLFPQLHPYYLPLIHEKLNVPETQTVKRSYAIEGMKKMRNGG